MHDGILQREESKGEFVLGRTCSKTGFPKEMAFSTCLARSAICKFRTLSPRLLSMFFTHLFAWPCGSTMRGQRRPRVVITPFSVENASAGKPWMFQSRTSDGSAKKSEKEKFALAGILRASIIGSHVLMTSSLRNSDGNGPAKVVVLVDNTVLHIFYLGMCYSVLWALILAHLFTSYSGSTIQNGNKSLAKSMNAGQCIDQLT